MRRPVVIAGGGPTGLAAALFLAERGIASVVLERGHGPSDDPRAATFHPPTLELLASSGATAKLHERGIVAALWQSRDRTDGLLAEFDLALLKDETPFPYRLQCEQHKFVGILTELLAERSCVEIRYGEEVRSVDAEEDHVRVETDQDAYEGEWLIGADGGRSLVRKSQEIDFEGFTYPERFLVITSTYDFAAEGFAVSNYVADPEEWCAVFQVPGDRPGGLWRTVFPIRAHQDEATELDFAHARARVDRFVPRVKPYEVVHTNIYTVHQRVAATFRKGRVLLIGDAAHINNPLGGMGMNFGLHDAANAAEKLATVLHGEAEDAVMDLYDRQRRFAASNFLQAMTIQNKKALEESDPQARAARVADLQATLADPVRAKAYLMQTAMIAGYRAAAAVK
jgi:3-(3-hydroxy-phenyl)propionate hydroxylase